MPRPCCPRRICHSATTEFFKPAGVRMCELEMVSLKPDELEALRLCDLEGLYHAEAAQRMGVSRQTLDRILKKAHQKVSKALIESCVLKIEKQAATPAKE